MNMIFVNGKKEKNHDNIDELLTALNYNKKNIAVLVNDNIIKREDWKGYKLKEKDRVEIVGFVGGG